MFLIKRNLDKTLKRLDIFWHQDSEEVKENSRNIILMLCQYKNNQIN